MAEWPIIGHEWAVRQLQIAVEHDEVPHALLITGPESVGKMTLGRTLAAALLCKGPEKERPCGTCIACRKLASGNHPDLMLVEPEEKGGSLKIEQIRVLERFLALTPNESAHKVALISSFEHATIGAANALLKTLEEPPAFAYLILLAGDTDNLLPTIVSRSQQINLRPLSHKAVEGALIERWRVLPDEAEHLARISGGRIGWAVQAATDADYHQRMENALVTLLSLMRQDLPSRFDTARELARDPTRLAEVLEYWLAGWRDVLLMQTGNAGDIMYREHREALADIAQRVDLHATIGIIKALEASQEALQRNANTLLLTENLILDLPDLGRSG